MPVEQPDFISGLVPSDPAGSESVGEADDHIRTLKRTITNTFAGDAGDLYDKPVTVGPDYLNGLKDTFAQYVTLGGDETITGEKTFTADVIANTIRDSDGEYVTNIYDVSGDKVTAYGNANNAVGIISENTTDIRHYHGGGDSIIITEDNFNALLLDRLYPVGKIELTIDDVNPGTRVGGTWVKVSDGRYLAGVGTGSDANDLEATVGAGQPSKASDGEYRVTLSKEELAPHRHSYEGIVTPTSGANSNRGVLPIDDETDPADLKYSSYSGGPGGDSQLNENTPADSHNNAPPYFGVYVWQRTA